MPNSESYLDLIPVQKTLQAGPLAYEYDLEGRIRLQGAHGEEIVRDVFTDVHVRSAFLSSLHADLPT
jgi:WD repeat-containing protein 89